MHLHERPQAAPLLVRQGIKLASSRMQNHAPYACTRDLTPASQKKSPFLMTGQEGGAPGVVVRHRKSVAEGGADAGEMYRALTIITPDVFSFILDSSYCSPK